MRVYTSAGSPNCRKVLASIHLGSTSTFESSTSPQASYGPIRSWR